MFSGLLGNLFKARQRMADEIERRRREDPDYDPDEELDDDEKPFLDHLEDLRITIMRVLLTLIAGLFLCFFFYQSLLAIIFKPVELAKLARVIWVEETEEVTGGFRLLPYYEEGEEPIVEKDGEKGEGEGEGGDAVEVESGGAAGGEMSELDPLVAAVEVRLEGIDARLDALEGQAKDAEAAEDAPEPLKIVSLGVPEAFMSVMKVCFLGAVIVTFPLLVYFLLQFVLPGLKRKEKRLLWPAMAVGTGLFLVGVLFAYYVALPRVLDFFYGFGSGIGVDQQFRIVEYIKFSTRLILLFGVCFELPVVVMALVKLDILNYGVMKKSRGVAVIVIFVVAAIITPTPDAATLCLLAVPMIVLYEICIWLAFLIDQRERKLHPELYDDHEDDDEDDGKPFSVDDLFDDEGEGKKSGGKPFAPPAGTVIAADPFEQKESTPGEPSGEAARTLEDYSEEDQAATEKADQDSSQDPHYSHQDSDHDTYHDPHDPYDYHHHHGGHHEPGAEPPSLRFTRAKLARMKLEELGKITESMGMGRSGYTRDEMIDLILDHQDIW